MQCDSILTIAVAIQKLTNSIDTTHCGPWQSPSGKYTYSTTGIYSDTVPTWQGCDSVIAIRFTQANSVSNTATFACSTITSPSGKFLLTTSGMYADTLLSTQGCDSVLLINFTLLPLVTTISKTNDITCDSTYALLQVTGGNSYSWQPAELLNSARGARVEAKPTVTTVFSVSIADTLGCSAIDSIQVLVNKQETIETLSNVFTPNGDGINDCLALQSIGNFKQVSFTVFNRWGNMVHSTTNPADCWNGTNKNNQTELLPGVYYFVLKGISTCDTPIEQKGTITLLR